jgi:tetratricopeptide (TPR) repeat protein
LICRGSKDRVGLAWATNGLGSIAWYQGDLDGATAAYQQSLDQFRQNGDRNGETLALIALGHIALANDDLDQAAVLYQEALVICRQTGSQRATAWALTGLGDVLDTRNSQQAAAFLEEAIDSRREKGRPPELMESLVMLAKVRLVQEQPAQALATLAEVMVYVDEDGRFDGSEYGLRNFWLIYQVMQANDHPRAAAVLETAYTLLQQQAGAITNPNLRRQFLESFPWHRAITAEGKNKDFQKGKD